MVVVLFTVGAERRANKRIHASRRAAAWRTNKAGTALEERPMEGERVIGGPVCKRREREKKVFPVNHVQH